MRLPKTSDYPKFIYLGGERYSIKFVRGFYAYGETDNKTKTITIRKGMGKAETFSTFIHEVLHFIEFEWPIKIKHKTVHKLEKAIFAFLLENFLS